MIEDLIYLGIQKPGFFANGTAYQSKGRWRAGNFIRFSEGTISPIGGWKARALSGDSIVGTPIAAVAWQLADGTPFLAVGTTNGLYVIDNNDACVDITPVSGISAPPYDWQLTIFGAFLIATNSVRGDDPHLDAVNVYVWEGDTAAAAVPAWTSAIGPRGVYATFATPERFLVTLRALDPSDAPPRTGVDGAYSERRVWWASQEQLDEFISTPENTGGSFDLQTDGRLVVGAATRGQSLLWTDVDLWSMTFIGGDLIYSFANVGRQCGIVGKHAFVMLDKGAFWMGRGQFFVYDGFVRPLPCEVTDHVFGDFNQQRAHTVFAVANPRYNEITWYYPAGGAQYPNRYVTYNHVEQHWVFGELARTAGVPRRFRRDVIDETRPALFGEDGTLYEHELGSERGAIAWIESGVIELGAGMRLMRIQGAVPDNTLVGTMQLKVYTAMVPNALETLHGPYTLVGLTPLRLTARQARIRIEDSGANDWRIGALRLAVRPAERRGGGSATGELTPASLEIIPTDVTMTAAQHFTFQAIVRNAAGQVLPIVPDAWHSSNPDLPIDTTGTVSANLAPAQTVVFAELLDPPLVSNNATVTVEPSPPTSLTIQPQITTIGEGLEQPMTATFRNAQGQIVTGISPTGWASDNPAAATVDENGIVTGVLAKANLLASPTAFAEAPWTHTGNPPEDAAASYQGLAFSRLGLETGVLRQDGILFESNDDVYITIYVRTAGVPGTLEGALEDTTAAATRAAWRFTVGGNGAITPDALTGTLVRIAVHSDKVYAATFRATGIVAGNAHRFVLRSSGTATSILVGQKVIVTQTDDAITSITATYQDEEDAIDLTSNAATMYVSNDMVTVSISEDTTFTVEGTFLAVLVGGGGGGLGGDSPNGGGGGGVKAVLIDVPEPTTATAVIGAGGAAGAAGGFTSLQIPGVNGGAPMISGGGLGAVGSFGGRSPGYVSTGAEEPPYYGPGGFGGEFRAHGNIAGGGGGGAGGNGGSATTSEIPFTTAGNGGPGITVFFDGVALGTFGGGGGGGTRIVDGVAGAPGGGGSGGGGNAGSPGADGLGGGGGGILNGHGEPGGHAGGDGRLLIAYRAGEAAVTF